MALCGIARLYRGAQVSAGHPPPSALSRCRCGRSPGLTPINLGPGRGHRGTGCWPDAGASPAV